MISKKKISSACRWIYEVAERHQAPSPGCAPGKGYATYTEFCQKFNLGDPYRNAILDALLLGVMKECEENGWPDLASLVIHEDGGNQRRGPGDGWYLGHGFLPGDIPTWERHRDGCWKRLTQFRVPD